MTDQGLVSAFVVGLVEGVRQLLRAGSHMETLNQILAWARAIVKDEGIHGSSEVCLVTALSLVALSAALPVSAANQHCYMCGGPNHLIRDCLACHEAGIRFQW
ncbi:hypothetical protein E2C01_043232 [Portunus trituberculatus]|uniref:CCHC-type domain-containing protein n=1 Tax=Portunus trituberculatus TaxID=210409 RepID=A0A5B7FWR5_PORTR|nr:hypothetical protein [Portunus trituberculatus]